MPLAEFEPVLDTQALAGAAAGFVVFVVAAGISAETRLRIWRCVPVLEITLGKVDNTTTLNLHWQCNR